MSERKQTRYVRPWMTVRQALALHRLLLGGTLPKRDRDALIRNIEEALR